MEYQGSKIAKLSKADRPSRGRPKGQNRVPLSLEERRARNALYEKERREESTRAMAELAKEIGCDPSGVQTDILASVISFIQSRTGNEDIGLLQACNERLMAQIADCESRLAVPGESTAHNADTYLTNKAKRKCDQSESPSDSCARTNKKYKKNREPEYDRAVQVVPQAESPPVEVALPNCDFLSTEEESLDSLLSGQSADLFIGAPEDTNDINNWSLDDLIDQYLL